MPAIAVVNTGGFAFAQLCGGGFAIGHRPGRGMFARLAAANVTHIATVLAESERPHDIETAARAAGLDWMWLQIGSTKNLPARSKPAVRRFLEELARILTAGGRIYLHCSAGIHRTGMIAAALLFHLGYDRNDVSAAIAGLRTFTAEGMGPERLDWASSFARAQ